MLMKKLFAFIRGIESKYGKTKKLIFSGSSTVGMSEHSNSKPEVDGNSRVAWFSNGIQIQKSIFSELEEFLVFC